MIVEPEIDGELVIEVNLELVVLQVELSFDLGLTENEL